MDGWMDGWMDGQTDGQTDRWVDAWVSGCVDGWVDKKWASKRLGPPIYNLAPFQLQLDFSQMFFGN